MTPEEFDTLVRQLREELCAETNLDGVIDDDEIRDRITGLIVARSKKKYLSLTQKQEVITAVFNSLRRWDIIQPLLDDKTITDIMINGPDEIFIEKEGQISQVDLQFETPEKLENMIQAIVARVNRVVNEATPIVDARLEDGSRVNVVLPPVALKGPTMTIRKFPGDPLTMDRLVALGTLSEEAARFLERLVQARYNIFISGGTGSGKTTFLNALSNFIPESERVITIEDSAELQLRNIKNLVSLETRNANTEGRGEITVRDLIRTSLRMRPDRIIVGEVRGPEALDMLQAMNTGHDGSLSTGHANTTRDMLSRLETMVLSAASFPVQVIRKQIAAALEIIVHLGRIRDSSRRVLEICEVAGFDGDEIVLNSLFQFAEEGEAGGVVLGALKNTGRQLTRTQKLKMAGISLD